MPIPTKRINTIDNPEADFYTRGQIKADIRAGKAKDFVKKIPSKLADIAFGEEGRLPLLASMIPGADLVDKLSSGKRPGVLDLPGLSDLKMLKMAGLTGLSLTELRKLFARYGEKMANKDAGEAYAKRMERLPMNIQESTAATIGRKESVAPGFKIPTISVGPPLTSGSNVKGYYKSPGNVGANNARQIWVKDTGDPDAVARTLVGLTSGRALPAELDKFGNPANWMTGGVNDAATYGKLLEKSIFGKNKGLFKDMDAISRSGDSKKLSEYLSKLYDSPEARYVLENADMGDKSITALSDLFKAKTGVPLKNSYDKGMRNNVLAGLLGGQVGIDDVKPIFEKPMPKSVNSLGAGLGGTYPKEDLFQLLAGGAKSMNNPTLTRRFRDLGGLDEKMIDQNMLPSMFRNLSDKDNNSPFKASFDEILKLLEKKTGDADPRNPKGKARLVNKFYFDDYL